jgi:membrane-bound ClpP family serine protease
LGEKAVREAASLSANAALQANVIDLIARDQAELLRQIDGRTVEVAVARRGIWRPGRPRVKRSIPDGSHDF